jgi:muramoyltetrapeptide carboxypeptidase LdcA involved in peptidoglycan recycling
MAKETKSWKPLQVGDKIALVFPGHVPPPQVTAEQFAKMEIAKHRGWVKAFGLELNNEDSINSLLDEETWGEKADAAQKRAQYIFDALNDMKVKAIYARGGHGTDEVILELEELFKEHGLPKRDDAIPLIGFSDATQLQLYLGELGLVSPIQVASDGSLEVKNLLFEQELQQKMPLNPVNAAAKREILISGKTIGGNDTAILSAHRSDYRLQTAADRNNILLLEGWNTYGVPKVLEVLEKQGQLGNTNAIILGKCYGNNGNENTIEEIEKAVKDLNIPVFIGAPIGHTKLSPEGFLPIPLNTKTTIETADGQSVISFSPVRLTEDIEEAKKAYEARQPWVTSGKRIGGEASKMLQPIELHPINPAEIPEIFIGCSVLGCDIPAVEGVDLAGQNLLIHISIPAEVKSLDYWSFAQKATMPMMELIKMGNAKNIKSITFSAPIPFPDRLKKTIEEFTKEHFAGKPVFTALIPQNSEMVQDLDKAAKTHPLPVKLNTKIIGVDSPGMGLSLC